MDWLNNPWIVGVGGGILSGFIVTFVSRALLSRRDRREYLQKVLSANREVIYALRASIPEGSVPSKEIVDALLSATARKYGVERKDMYNSKEIAEELIKEVMDTSFISSKMKEEYCQRLNSLAQPTAMIPEKEKEALLESRGKASEVSQYRTRMISMMSVMMGVMAAMMTTLVAFLQFRGRLTPDSENLFPRETLSLMLPALLSVLTVTVASAMMMFYRELKERRKDTETKSKEKDSNDSTQRDSGAT